MIYEIALARTKEICDLILFKNINLNYYNNYSKNIYLEISDKSHVQAFKEIYETTFSNYRFKNLFFLDNLSNESMLNSAHKLVHFGWKREAIPISQHKKSLINRFFDAFFG